MIIWLVIMIPCSLLFSGLGIYAWRRKEPMWFYSGSTVKSEEIRDIPAYNRANGIMWLAFSAFFCICTVLGAMNMRSAGFLMLGGTVLLCFLLPVTYHRIYDRYKA